MKKIKLLLLFAAINITGIKKMYAQDINTISAVPNNHFNQVFDPNGNMYYIHDDTRIDKMDAGTGSITMGYAGAGTITGFSGWGGPRSL